MKVLNKRVTVDQNLVAVDLLTCYDVGMAVGFVLFDTGSTVAIVRGYWDFLHRGGGDGHFAISFCKMLPYAGILIEARLRSEGCLAESLAQPDYRFLDPPGLQPARL